MNIGDKVKVIDSGDCDAYYSINDIGIIIDIDYESCLVNFNNGIWWVNMQGLELC